MFHDLQNSVDMKKTGGMHNSVQTKQHLSLCTTSSPIYGETFKVNTSVYEVKIQLYNSAVPASSLYTNAT